MIPITEVAWAAGFFEGGFPVERAVMSSKLNA
jgi:hypothetical protein